MTDLSSPSIKAMIALRRDLHRNPELSGEEEQTAARVVSELTRFQPDDILIGLGGHGVAAVFNGHEDGPTILFRCELDGLPIREVSTSDWRSQTDGKAHLCGHDGHTAILCGLGAELAVRRPARGRVILMFQPAEETGAGAAGVIADPRFASIQPDYAFALHNLPGLPMSTIGIRPGPFTFASEGLAIRLMGRTSHAAQPEAGHSPAGVMATLMDQLPKLPHTLGHKDGHSLVTLSHARLGEAAFGISPGEADIWVTIRAIDDALQTELFTAAQELAKTNAEKAGFGIELTRHEGFVAGHNDPEASAYIVNAMHDLGLEQVGVGDPFRWSEDFGRFGSVAKSALFVLGAGIDHPRLHNQDYDFPDELIAPGVAMFANITRSLCGLTNDAPRN